MALYRARPSRIARFVAPIALVVATTLTSTTSNRVVGAAAVGDAPVMTMYVPLAEQEISDGLFSIYRAGAASAADIVSTITITSAADDSLIYWDHWEDGYEADLSAPASPSTQVWGDEDLSNGAAPGVTVAADDVVDLGTVIFLQDTVELPRSDTQIFYDGRDKIAASRGFSMSRAGWDSGLGAAHAGAVAATDTSKYGTRFDIPIGEDAGFGAFDYTGLSVQVADDDTSIDIDIDGDGTIDQSAVRNEGESLYIDGGVTVGTVVSTTSPAQVHLITGRLDSRYEGRWFEVFPAETLADEYVAAAGSFSATQLVTIFLYNPNDDPIDIDATTAAGTNPLTVPAGEVVAIDLPNGSGGRFSSPGNGFSAVSGTVARTGSTVAYDWGYSLVPTTLLTPTVFVGWGAGNPGNTASNSPVWVAPLADTTIFVDRDADGTADEAIAATAYESVRVVDPDHDLTGARIYSDDTLLSVAWGQDAAIQPSNAYDLGTAILPTAALISSKSAELSDDVNGDGLVDPGDELTYSIELFDAGAQAITGLVVTDELPSTLAYVEDSTSFQGSPVDDSATGTPNPLDETGLAVTDLAPGGSSTVSFRARVITAFPFGVDTIANTVSVSAQQTSATSTVITPITPIFPATIAGSVWADLDADATQDADESGTDSVTVTIVGPSHPGGSTTITTNGVYSFGDLAPGTYTVTVDRSATSPLPQSAYSSTGGDTRQIILASGDTLDATDFGYVLPASVSGTVYDDVDVDDVIDPGEAPFSAVEVTINGPGLPPTGRTQTTTAAGAYTFSNLDPGTFTITAAPATGDLPAFFVRTGGVRRVTVTADDHSTGNDLGFHNPLPAAVDDAYTTDIGRALTITDAALGVLSNDDPGNAPITVVSADTVSTAGGTVTVAGDGTFTYAPPTNFTGTDTFEYILADASGDEATAQVSVTVASPTSISGVVWHDRNADGRISPGEQFLRDITVERRDCTGNTLDTTRTDQAGRYDFDGQVPGCHRIDIESSSLPSDVATPTFDRDGGFDSSAEILVPAGTDVSDADFGFVNLVPDAATDRVTTDEGAAVTFDPLANDVDPEGRALTVTFATVSGGGSATSDGTTITYTPAAGFDGSETVVYTVCDPAGECSTATAIVTVTNTNDPPRVRAGGASISVTIGQPLPPLDVVDDEGDAITASIVGGSLPAGVTLGTDGTFSGVPTAAGIAPGSTTTFDVELCDARGACTTVAFSITARAATGGGTNIPNSGSESMRFLPSALGMLLLGGMLTIGSRRRHTTERSA